MVRLIEKFCIREKVAAGIIAVAILMLSFGWIATYMQSKTLLTTTEHQRDSIAYTLNKFIQAYDTVIIDGDTIKHNR
jgi:cell division protein FtsL